jgi:hypothetical protein
VFFRAKLARFYSWTHQYINSLDWDIALEYYCAIDVLESQETLNGISVSTFPHMKTDSRKDYHSKIMKRSKVKDFQTETSFEDFARQVGLING